MNRKHMTRIALAAASMAAVMGAHAGEADPFVDQTIAYNAPYTASTSPINVMGQEGVMTEAYALHGDAVAPEQESLWTPRSTALRGEVKQELQALSSAGALTRAGEIAEPRPVLMARQRLNNEQAEAMRAAYLAEAQRLTALQADDGEVVTMVSPLVLVIVPE